MGCLCDEDRKHNEFKAHDEIMILVYRSSSYRDSAKHLIRLLLTEAAFNIAQLK